MTELESPNEETAKVEQPVAVRTIYLLYRFLPIGSYTLEFNNGTNDSNTRTALISGTTCCCCTTKRSVTNVKSLKVCRQPLWNCLRLVRDVILSFVAAFMFHLVPAVIWGPEQSLGSSANHRAMGMVWFLGWPIWFLLMLFWRPWGIEVLGTDNDAIVFVPFCSWKQANEVATWWQHSANDEPPTAPKLIRNPWFLFGWLFFLFLFVNMIVTGILVMQCIERGCCVDNQDTLDCCVETGYPEC